MPFDGFISYSHAADGRLAPAVQRGLHRLAKPWHQRRALWIFRDQTGLAVTPKLWTSIQEALDGSKHFVLLASPEAANSQWVNREIEHWLATKSPDRILPVVTDGEWCWDPAAKDFTEESTSVPAALRGVFAEEPLYLDLRWARDDLHLSLQHIRFRDAIAQLAAPMHGVSKDELEGEDVRQHRRARRLSAVAVAMLVLLTLVASLTGVFAVRNADRAETAAANALVQQRLASEQRSTAERATEESQRQQENARVQEGRALEAGSETRRQEQLAEQKQALAETATAEAKRQQVLAENAAAQVKREQALAQDAAAEAKREQANAARYRADAVAEQAHAERYKADAAREQAVAEQQKAEAEEQKELAQDATEEAERQKANAERQKAVAEQQMAYARQQQELADQATARAKEQEKLAAWHRAQAEKAEVERKRQEGLARQAAEEARRQREAAELQQRVVINQRLMDRARAMIVDDPKKGLMLGVAAQRVHDTALTRQQLSHLAMATDYASSIADVIDVVAVGARVIATTGSGGTVSLWNTADPEKPVRLTQLTAGGTTDKTLAASRDGKTLAVYDGGPEAVLWNVADPARPARITTIPDAAGIVTVTFSPDGRTVATSNSAKNTVLWDISGAAPAILSTLTGAYPLEFGPDGRTAVTSGATVLAWNLADLTAPVKGVTITPGWGDPVPDAKITYHPKQPVVAVQGPSGYLYLWDLTDPAKPRQGTSQLTSKGDALLSTMEFSPDGTMAAIGDSDGRTEVWGYENTNQYPSLMARIATPTARGGPVRAMAFSPDGRTLTTAGYRQTGTVWYSNGRYDKKPIATMPGPFPGRVVGIAFGADNRSLLAAGRDGIGVSWDLSDPANPVRTDGLKLYAGKIVQTAQSKDGRTLAVAGLDNVVTLLDMSRPAEPAVLSTFSDPGKEVWAMMFSPDGRTLVVGHSNGKTSLWDLTDRTAPNRLTELALRDMLQSIAFSPDGRVMAVGEGYNVSMWDMTDRSAPGRLTSIPLANYGGYHANTLEFSPDGRTMAAATTESGSAMLWDVADPAQPRKIATLAGHSGYAYSATYSPDGQTLATAGMDNSMVLWDITDPDSPVRYTTFKTPDMQSFHMALSPDGRTLAASSTYASSKNVTLWDATVPADLAADPVRNACAVSGRGLDAGEWARYVPELPYQPTC
ncbi:WD40 repeat protein [Actinoplanes lutulentus]|uniref:WD40 repeat protein n=1 Tax=Actinoplanes lutulentus TaxID=1287878 RepID=A0A327ZAZ3_9ACTN|nr:TIR domain-containing protein [Actinoplanes lutulentus]MBB2946664.1 WD40 repeat protein [Actinoplanes lutulentus]RAK35558.1 WD40 repeat protein [Actinoplanes lutulentus]